MPIPEVGYSASIKEITSISPSDRVDGYCRITRGISNNWYMFVASSEATPDGINVLIPDDNPDKGRWHKSNNITMPGVTTCGYQDGECNLEGSGKVFEFFAPFEGQVIVQPAFDIIIGDFWEQELINNDEVTRDKSIEVFLWEERPYFDINMDKRKFIANLPRVGGVVDIKVDQTHRWLSVFACADGSSDRDATCFVANNNIINLIDFS